MPKKPETIFGEKFDAAFKKRFGKQGKIENIQQVGKVGTPDRMGVVRGRFVAFELKMPEGVVAPLQIVKLSEFKHAGGLCYIVYPKIMNKVLAEVDRLTFKIK